MKIQMLQSAAGPNFPEGVAPKGRVLDLDKEVAQELIDSGLACLVVEAKKAVEEREKAVLPQFQKREKRNK